MLMREKMRFGWRVGAVVAGLAASSALATPPPIVTLQSGVNPPSSAPANLLSSGSGANQGTFSSPSGTGYGDPILKIQGGNASYMPSYVNSIHTSGPGDAADFLQVSGFTSGDVEIYALKLDYNGSYLDPVANATVLGNIITDINNNNAAGGGSIASTIPAMLQGDFPGYDVALTIPSSFINMQTAGTPVEYDFGFNFSSLPNVSGTVTVTDIGVIPEPASAALLGVLVVPALASRRRSAI